MQSKNALGNLKNRYVAVLKKCNLINVFGSLAVVGMLTMGAGSAVAATLTPEGVDPVISNTGENVELSNRTDLERKYSEEFTYGAWVTSQYPDSSNNAGTATANGNTFTYAPVNASSSNNVYASSAESYGGSPTALGDGGNANTATANSNTLVVSDTNLNTYITKSVQQASLRGGNAFSHGGNAHTDGAGGAGGNAIASENTMQLTNVITTAPSYGGYAESLGGAGAGAGNGGASGDATASKNKITLTDAAGSPNGSQANYYGGYARSEAGDGGSGGVSGAATANENVINIQGGNVSSLVGGDALSSASGTAKSGTATANNNTVTISATTNALNIKGGNAQSTASSALPEGTRAGSMSDAIANYNTVHIYGETTGVYGGTSWLGIIRQEDIDGVKSEANFNEIYIYDGARFGNDDTPLPDPSDPGAYVLPTLITAGKSKTQANNNIVSLNGTIAFRANGLSISGGEVEYGNEFTGNTLILDRFTTTAKLTEVTAFEKYDFILPASTSTTGSVLTVETIDFTDNSWMNSSGKTSYINTVSIDKNHSLSVNDVVTLIQADNMNGTLANNGETVTSNFTTFTEQEWRIDQVAGSGTDGTVTATFLSEDLTTDPNPDPDPDPTPGPDTDSNTGSEGGTLAGTLAESQTKVGASIVKAAGQSFANAGIPAAQQASSQVSVNAGSMTVKQGVWAPFATIQGGYSTYDSGSDTDVNSVSLIGGLAYTSYFDKGELIVGAFFETGTGSYDSTSYSGNNRIKSEGDLNYFGGGLFGRYDFNTNNGTPYLEASARFGSIDSDYSTNDITDMTTGRGVNYDSNATYYGMHFGVGYLYEIAPKWELDLSAKYFWTHHESVNESIGGNNFEFDAIDSHVLRVGTKVSYDAIDNGTYSFSPYAGLAYEYEFDSNASARVDNIPIPSESDLRGSTGVLELGARYEHTNGFSVNFGVDGSIGKRESIGGKLEFMYKF